MGVPYIFSNVIFSAEHESKVKVGDQTIENWSKIEKKTKCSI